MTTSNTTPDTLDGEAVKHRPRRPAPRRALIVTGVLAALVAGAAGGWAVGHFTTAAAAETELDRQVSACAERSTEQGVSMDHLSAAVSHLIDAAAVGPFRASGYVDRASSSIEFATDSISNLPACGDLPGTGDGAES